MVLQYLGHLHTLSCVYEIENPIHVSRILVVDFNTLVLGFLLEALSLVMLKNR